MFLCLRYSVRRRSYILGPNRGAAAICTQSPAIARSLADQAGKEHCHAQDKIIELCNAATGKNVRVAHCPQLDQTNLDYLPTLSVSSHSPCVNVGSTGATRGQTQRLVIRCDHSCSKDWRLNTWLRRGPKISCRSGSQGERIGEGVDGGQLGL